THASGATLPRDVNVVSVDYLEKTELDCGYRAVLSDRLFERSDLRRGLEPQHVWVTVPSKIFGSQPGRGISVWLRRFHGHVFPSQRRWWRSLPHMNGLDEALGQAAFSPASASEATRLW